MVKIIVLNVTSFLTTYILLVAAISVQIIGGLCVVLDLIINGICLLLIIPMHNIYYINICWYFSKYLFRLLQSFIRKTLQRDARNFVQTPSQNEHSISSN